MKTSDYQQDLSLQSPVLLDAGYKTPKVEKMLAVLRDVGAIGERRGRLALDVGCSGGFFASALAPYFDHVIGVDIDTHALKIARDNAACARVHYLVGDSMNMPLLNNSVDLIICNHVYEHVPDCGRLFADIHRLLSPDGVCYLGSASRLTIIEPHYGLPFLSWLPKSMANRYMRWMGKGDRYYENLRTYWGIKRMVGCFEIEDYTLKVINAPDQFKVRDLIPKGSMLEKIPMGIWKAFYWLLPSYILILSRREKM